MEPNINFLSPTQGQSRALDGAPEETDEEEVFERDDDVIRSSYPCGSISQYFCLLHGPLARAEAGGPEPPRRIEREARSQRLGVVRVTEEEEEGKVA